jgi:hypothetical protein
MVNGKVRRIMTFFHFFPSPIYHFPSQDAFFSILLNGLRYTVP